MGNKTLYMTFALDNEKTKTLALPSPKDDISSDEVRSVMNNCVAKGAMVVNGAELIASKTAYVREVNNHVLF